MTLVPEQVLTMQVPFDHLGVVHSVLNRVQVLHREEQYTQGGMWVDAYMCWEGF